MCGSLSSFASVFLSFCPPFPPLSRKRKLAPTMQLSLFLDFRSPSNSPHNAPSFEETQLSKIKSTAQLGATSTCNCNWKQLRARAQKLRMQQLQRDCEFGQAELAIELDRSREREAKLKRESKDFSCMQRANENDEHKLGGERREERERAGESPQDDEEDRVGKSLPDSDDWFVARARCVFTCAPASEFRACAVRTE